MNTKRYINRLFGAWKKCASPGEAYVHYDQHEDFLKFVARPVHHYAHWIDSEFAVYYSAENERDVIGCQIRGVSALVKSMFENVAETISVGSILHRITEQYEANRNGELAEIGRQLETLARETNASIDKAALQTS